MKNMIEDMNKDIVIQLPNILSKILTKVIKYCKYQVNKQKWGKDKLLTLKDKIKACDTNFVKVDQETLFEVIFIRNGTMVWI